MKVVQINNVMHGSTGKIMLNIADTVRKNGDKAYNFSENRGKEKAIEGHRQFGFFVENLVHRAFSVLTGISGTGSWFGTKQLLKELDKLCPDVLHIHNLHGWYINLPMLFTYIRKNKIKTIWTLHDCWGFTAQCSHFTMEKCDKWKTGCHHCPRYKLYPYTWVDRTKIMWKLKKAWFSGVEDMTIVTPSEWLANLVQQSFLKEYSIKVINNGIDTTVFKPTHGNFRETYDLLDKKIILGVASGWTYRKGLDVFVELSRRLDSNIYQIILVGTDNGVDAQLPKNIISIHKTNNIKELVEIYSTANVFVNPTREENFPTVNMEAIACGTPVVTFDTGGCKEILNEHIGAFVPVDDIDLLESEICRICHTQFNPKKFEMTASYYNKKWRYEEYVVLYN